MARPLQDGDVVDFASIVPQRWNDPAIVITIERRVALGEHRKPLCASIRRERTSGTGRKLKPELILNLVIYEDEGGIDALLHQVADLFKLGTVEIGEEYPAP